MDRLKAQTEFESLDDIKNLHSNMDRLKGSEP